MRSRFVIGIDFDNTIVHYGELMYRLALERGWITAQIPPDKRAIRDYLRSLPGGVELWERLQGSTYGPEIAGASLATGFREFLRRASAQNALLYVVSHKTEFSPFDETGTNLHSAALDWMVRQGLFEAESGLRREAIWFASTRQDKIARIRGLHCTHFIDDLPDVFEDQSFPAHVRKILYAPRAGSAPTDVAVLSSWPEIGRRVFAGCN